MALFYPVLHSSRKGVVNFFIKKWHENSSGGHLTSAPPWSHPGEEMTADRSKIRLPVPIPTGKFYKTMSISYAKGIEYIVIIYVYMYAYILIIRSMFIAKQFIQINVRIYHKNKHFLLLPFYLIPQDSIMLHSFLLPTASRTPKCRFTAEICILTPKIDSLIYI